jgi:hypothetical protein
LKTWGTLSRDHLGPGVGTVSGRDRPSKRRRVRLATTHFRWLGGTGWAKTGGAGRGRPRPLGKPKAAWVETRNHREPQPSPSPESGERYVHNGDYRDCRCAMQGYRRGRITKSEKLDRSKPRNHELRPNCVRASSSARSMVLIAHGAHVGATGESQPRIPTPMRRITRIAAALRAPPRETPPGV